MRRDDRRHVFFAVNARKCLAPRNGGNSRLLSPSGGCAFRRLPASGASQGPEGKRGANSCSVNKPPLRFLFGSLKERNRFAITLPAFPVRGC